VNGLLEHHDGLDSDIKLNVHDCVPAAVQLWFRRMLVDLTLIARPSKLPAAPPAPQSLLLGVSSTGDELLREAEHLRARRIVVVVVEVFDNLIGPASLEHVAAHHVSPQ
jgi:hypothetical protein